MVRQGSRPLTELSEAQMLIAAVHYIGLADRLLEAVDASAAKRQMIWQIARYDVSLEHGDLPQTIQRALAGKRIVSMFRTAMEGHQ